MSGAHGNEALSALQDIGFDGISPEPGTDDNVINRYFDVYFPRAIETAKALKARNANLSYVFTTQVGFTSSWYRPPRWVE